MKKRNRKMENEETIFNLDREKYQKQFQDWQKTKYFFNKNKLLYHNRS